MKLPPALVARATDELLQLLGEPPGRVLEVGLGGITTTPLRLAGFEVDVLDDDPRAAERAGATVAAAQGTYDAVVAPADADLAGIAARRVLRIGARIGSGGLVLRDEPPPAERP